MVWFIVDGRLRTGVSMHQPVANEHALVGERGRRHFDAEVSAAAVHFGL